MTLDGRVAVVTGGTGALGQAVTRRLLAAGAAVVVPYLREGAGEALAARLEPAERARLVLARADVTDDAAMQALAASARARHGRIDILVALVGGFAPGRLVETDRATWERMLALNLTSLFVAARAVVPHLVEAGGGRVVTVSSRAILPPGAGFIAYATAKAGVVAFTQALAQELRPAGVTVNCVLPSTMDTPANRAAMPQADRRAWVPVESVAEAIAFLVSDAARHVTGALVAV